MFTFAQDSALDVGLMPLLAGSEVTANPFSLLGDMGRDFKIVVLERLLGRLKVVAKKYPTGGPG